MIWIAWRFQRSVVCALALVALVFVAATMFLGVMQHHDLASYMSAPCHGQQPATPGRGDYCGELAVKLANVNMYATYIRAVGYVIGPLTGGVVGILALASEVDNRTVRLAWTQSISRTRWFAAKMGVGAASVAIILVPTAVALSWWNGAIGDRDIFKSETYGIAGWDLVAYGLFMFALTVLLGAVIRRTGWTLAVSLLLYLVVAVTFPSGIRVHLATPTVRWSEPAAPSNRDGNNIETYPYNAWLLVEGVVPRSTTGIPTSREVNDTYGRVGACVVSYQTTTESEYVKAELKCYKKFNVENVAVYIADGEFWTLQLREGILYLTAGLISAGGALAIVRRIEP